MAHWMDLPDELVEQILDQLFQQSRPTSNNKGGFIGGPLERPTPECLQYLTTCKKWKALLEPRIYKNLFLTGSTLRVLRRLTPEHQELVEYIWLALEQMGGDSYARFPLYTYIPDEAAYNAHILLAELRELFEALSKWKSVDGGSVGTSAGGSSRPRGLTLEISVTDNRGRNFCFPNLLHFDSCPFTLPGELEVNRPDVDESEREWQDCRSVDSRLYYLSAMQFAVLETSVDAGTRPWVARGPVFDKPSWWPEEYPRFKSVPAVTKFIMRRQTRRRFTPAYLFAMVGSLTNLESMVMEPWMDVPVFPETGIHPFDAVLGDMIALRLPPTLKHFTLFEDFNDDITFLFARTPPMPPGFFIHHSERFRTPSALVADALVSRSARLETLAASYIVDADDVLAAAAAAWPALTSLHLTADILLPRIDTVEINKTLRAAGRAALRMPALRTMVLWNGLAGVAAEFRFEVKEHRHATVRWRGTFALPLERVTRRVWELVAQRRTGFGVTVEESVMLDVKKIYSHGAAMWELGLGGHVIHTVSLEQVRCETSRSLFRLM